MKYYNLIKGIIPVYLRVLLCYMIHLTAKEMHIYILGILFKFDLIEWFSYMKGINCVWNKCTGKCIVNGMFIEILIVKGITARYEIVDY